MFFVQLLAVFTTVGASALFRMNMDAYELRGSVQLRDIMRMIENEIGVPYANDLSECRLVAVSDLCPYRQIVLAYSTTKTNEDKLSELVGRYNQLERQFERQRKPEQRRICPAMTPRKRKLELRGGVCTAVDELKQKYDERRRNIRSSSPEFERRISFQKVNRMPAFTRQFRLTPGSRSGTIQSPGCERVAVAVPAREERKKDVRFRTFS